VTRVKAAWIAAAVVVLAGVAYLVRRRRTSAIAPPATAPVVELRATTAAPPVIVPPSPIDEESSVQTEVRDVGQDDDEQPLATWARLAIVAVALLAFFAVSLIATKQV
jgi:cytochrome oxidase assembly protein ShyY1